MKDFPIGHHGPIVRVLHVKSVDNNEFELVWNRRRSTTINRCVMVNKSKNRIVLYHAQRKIHRLRFVHFLEVSSNLIQKRKKISHESLAGTYSNWTDWSKCRLTDCTSIRTRQCLQEPCLENLVESRICKSNLCSSMSFWLSNWTWC